MPQQDKIKPRYEVETVNETVIETHFVREDDRNVEKKVEVPYGYNVYFPAGHSIRVRTNDELRRLGFDVPAELIDEDTGDVVGTTRSASLKQNVQRRAGAARRSDTTAVEANQ
jgi:hypothetical protein